MAHLPSLAKLRLHAAAPTAAGDEDGPDEDGVPIREQLYKDDAPEYRPIRRLVNLITDNREADQAQLSAWLEELMSPKILAPTGQPLARAIKYHAFFVERLSEMASAPNTIVLLRRASISVLAQLVDAKDARYHSDFATPQVIKGLLEVVSFGRDPVRVILLRHVGLQALGILYDLVKPEPRHDFPHPAARFPNAAKFGFTGGLSTVNVLLIENVLAHVLKHLEWVVTLPLASADERAHMSLIEKLLWRLVVGYIDEDKTNHQLTWHINAIEACREALKRTGAVTTIIQVAAREESIPDDRQLFVEGTRGLVERGGSPLPVLGRVLVLLLWVSTPEVRAQAMRTIGRYAQVRSMKRRKNVVWLLKLLFEHKWLPLAQPFVEADLPRTLALLAGVDSTIPVDRMWSESRRIWYKNTLDWRAGYSRLTRACLVKAVAEVFTVTDLDRKVMASIYDSGLVQVVASMLGKSFSKDTATRFFTKMVSAMPTKFKIKRLDETHQVKLLGLPIRTPDDAEYFATPSVLIGVETFYDRNDERLNERNPQFVERAVAEYGAVWDAWHMETPEDAKHDQPNPVASFNILMTAAFHDLRPSRRAAMDLAVLLVAFACHYQDQLSKEEVRDCGETAAELEKRGFDPTQLNATLFATNLRQLAEWPMDTIDKDVPDSFSPEQRERLLTLRRIAEIASKLSFMYAKKLKKDAADADAAAIVAVCHKAEALVTKPFSGVDGARTLWARADMEIDELEKEGMLEPGNADDGRTDAERAYALFKSAKRALPAPSDEDGEGVVEEMGKRARIAASAAIRASALGVVGAAMAEALVARCLA